MPRPTTSHKLLFAMLVVGVFALPGCKRAGEAIAEKTMEHASGDKVDIEQNGDTVSIKTDKGEMKVATAQDGASVALPADFPTDVFLPEQRTISSAMDMGGMKAVNIATSASPAQVSADVEKTMQAQGWKREMSMQTGADSSTLIYSKDKRQAVYQMMKAEDGGTQLAVRTGGED
ncbi:hypothetical protein [Thermomonas sp. HDW16]|uniref:hypothetical protein n=1 Tax=Thermomonas sp. HDW16 TaxID=2714945 RepID=UPI001407A2F6|nr:hypothetical protein [Thermomonas sp. HDW16]QIL19518.1 hypothetical protein G7079_01540 [Thermomonas sp. HDW16]